VIGGIEKRVLAMYGDRLVVFASPLEVSPVIWVIVSLDDLAVFVGA